MLLRIWTFVALLVVALPVLPRASADTMGLLSGPLVDHPVRNPLIGRSAAHWRTSVGVWGENLVAEMLRLRGFNEIHEIKTGGNHGVDRVAVKRDRAGVMRDRKFVEVKTSRSPKPSLNHTKYGGAQMSERHIAENLKKMRHSGDPKIRELALEINRFNKTTRQPLKSMGEVVHVNTKTGLIVGYASDGRSEKYIVSAARLFKQIQRRGSSPEVRNWAARSLSQWDQINAESMSSWLGVNVEQQSKRSIIRSFSKSVGVAEIVAVRQAQRLLAKKILQRVAGPIAVAASLAFDSKELFDTELAYRQGSISGRQRATRNFKTVGGMTGAFAGASTGSVGGAWLGAFGGPIAWFTVPAGGFLGGTIGGVAGYFGGSSIAEHGATAWYRSMDAAVQEKFEVAWLSSNPLSN